jgi:hypothetical protein
MAAERTRTKQLRHAQQRERRIERARAALDALQPGEWDEVMQHYCKACGGEPSCVCWNDE